MEKAPAKQVYELVSFLKRGGECWQFHALMRTLVLTNQGHLIPKDIPNRDVYFMSTEKCLKYSIQPQFEPQLLGGITKLFYSINLHKATSHD